jgi:hypothetical protein
MKTTIIVTVILSAWLYAVGLFGTYLGHLLARNFTF